MNSFKATWNSCFAAQSGMSPEYLVFFLVYVFFFIFVSPILFFFCNKLALHRLALVYMT